MTFDLDLDLDLGLTITHMFIQRWSTQSLNCGMSPTLPSPWHWQQKTFWFIIFLKNRKLITIHRKCHKQYDLNKVKEAEKLKSREMKEA